VRLRAGEHQRGVHRVGIIEHAMRREMEHAIVVRLTLDARLGGRRADEQPRPAWIVKCRDGARLALGGRQWRQGSTGVAACAIEGWIAQREQVPACTPRLRPRLRLRLGRSSIGVGQER